MGTEFRAGDIKERCVGAEDDVFGGKVGTREEFGALSRIDEETEVLQHEVILFPLLYDCPVVRADDKGELMLRIGFLELAQRVRRVTGSRQAILEVRSSKRFRALDLG